MLQLAATCYELGGYVRLPLLVVITLESLFVPSYHKVSRVSKWGLPKLYDSYLRTTESYRESAA